MRNQIPRPFSGYYWRAILDTWCAAGSADRLICVGLSRKQVSLSWGVVQPVGHLTVNEDGEGSNPSAPANPPETARFIFSVLTKYGLSSHPRTGPRKWQAAVMKG